MAPFKLKFRMGSSSRSTSLETAPRLTSTSVTSSTTTIDSQFNSLGSLNNDQRNLLPAVDNDDHIGNFHFKILHNSNIFLYILDRKIVFPIGLAWSQ